MKQKRWVKMFEYIKIIFAVLSGGLAGAIFKHFFDIRNREKKLLTYNIISRQVIERGHPELEIRYHNQPIDSLFSYKVILRNEGNRALKNLPIQIICDSGKFIGPIEKVSPQGSETDVDFQDDAKKIVLKCDLLNPNEELQLGASLVNSINREVTVVARDDYLICAPATKEPQKPDRTPFFILLLIITVVGLGSMRNCSPETQNQSPIQLENIIYFSFLVSFIFTIVFSFWQMFVDRRLIKFEISRLNKTRRNL
jgi:hypothetical protein